MTSRKASKNPKWQINLIISLQQETIEVCIPNLEHSLSIITPWNMKARRQADETCPAKNDAVGMIVMVRRQWLEIDMWNGIERSVKYLFKVVFIDLSRPVICIKWNPRAKLWIVFKRSLLTYWKIQSFVLVN